MPYLVDKYSYTCFKEFNNQLEKQYNAMPEAFKGIFTHNEKGKYVQLISSEESKKRMDDFWTNQREKIGLK